MGGELRWEPGDNKDDCHWQTPSMLREHKIKVRHDNHAGDGQQGRRRAGGVVGVGNATRLDVRQSP